MGGLMPETMELEIVYTGPADSEPVYATEYSAGADLKACIEESLVLEPGSRTVVPTGLHLAIPSGWEGQVRPRSGLALKTGLTILNAPGTIDADYRGEVKVILVNLGDREIEITPGMRIAQLIFSRAPRAVFRRVEELPVTDRGGGGFGSTGI